ncbi:MAG: flagellar hook-length control protein FliK [Acidimicrobiales bacterium]
MPRGAGRPHRTGPAAPGAAEAKTERSDDPTGNHGADRLPEVAAASLQAAQAMTAAAPAGPTADTADGRTTGGDPLAVDTGAGPIGSGTGTGGGATAPLSPAVQPGTALLPGETPGAAPAGAGTGPGEASGPDGPGGEGVATGDVARSGGTGDAAPADAGTTADGTAGGTTTDAAIPDSAAADSAAADGSASSGGGATSDDSAADGDNAGNNAVGSRTATGPDRPDPTPTPASGPLSALAAATANANAPVPAGPAPAGRPPAATAEGIEGPHGTGPRPGAADRADADPRSLDGRLAAALNGDPAAPPTGTAPSAPANGSTRSAGADPLWRQVQRALNAVHVNAEGNHEMTIRLRPDHLGSLTVKVTTGEAGTTVALVAESRAAAQQLEQQRHLLADELNGGGLRGAAIDIGLGSGPSSGGTPGRDGTGAATSSHSGPGSGSGSPAGNRSGRATVGVADSRPDTGRAEALRTAARRRSTASVDLAL